MAGEKVASWVDYTTGVIQKTIFFTSNNRWKDEHIFESEIYLDGRPAGCRDGCDDGALEGIVVGSREGRSEG